MAGLPCDICIGVDKCSKYCELQAGMNLVGFINGLDIIETQIGELRRGVLEDGSDLMVCGQIIECRSTPVYSLRPLNANIRLSGKFLNFKGCTPTQLIDMVLNYVRASQDSRVDSINTFKRFDSSRLLAIPIKVGSACSVDYKDSSGETIKSSCCKVSMIRWWADTDTGELNCSVYITVKRSLSDTWHKEIELPISEYGLSFSIPSIDNGIDKSAIDNRLIRMTSTGFIKPIVIRDSKCAIAIDSKYVYNIASGDEVIIGKWTDKGIKEFKDSLSGVLKSSAYKKFKDNMEYIQRHLRFIAPYGLYMVNKVDIENE